MTAKTIHMPVFPYIVLTAILVIQNTAIADIMTGKQLHNENCMDCHQPAIYTRENNRVKSLPALQKQINRCQDDMGLDWTKDDIDKTKHYLNTTYYHFKHKMQ